VTHDRTTLDTLSDEEILSGRETGPVAQTDTDGDDVDVDTDDADSDADLDDPS
jgi:hypothetical protein